MTSSGFDDPNLTVIEQSIVRTMVSAIVKELRAGAQNEKDLIGAEDTGQVHVVEGPGL